MTSRRGIDPSAPAICGAALTFGLLVYALLPAAVCTLDDDFGYLRSIVGTLQRHRPWTHDFLEPWSASHSVLCALAYHVTGSFHAATYGLQACFGALAMVAIGLLLRARSFSTPATLVVAGLFLTFPVLLWRALEFTGMALYVPCLLWAIWAAENRRWLVFFAVWTVAAASRQSAVAWLAWPACELVQALITRHERPLKAARAPAAVLLAGIGVLLALAVTMNSTVAQQRMTLAVDRIQLSSTLVSAAVGVLALLLGAGLAAIARAASASPPGLRGPWTKCGMAGALAGGCIALWLDPTRYVITDHLPLMTKSGWIYARLVLLLGLAGWVIFRFQLRAAATLCAGASVLLISLRPGLWDYYLIDAALFGFFAVVPSPDRERGTAILSGFTRRAFKPLLTVALALLAVFHLRTAFHFKVTLDRAAAICTVFERALRANRLDVLELHDATFGFKGWHLYEYGSAREARRRWFSEGLFPAPKTVRLEVTRPDLPSPPPPAGPETVGEETWRIGWFASERYRLVRLSPRADPVGSPAPVTPGRFPLNDREWREWISGRRADAAR